MEATKHEKRMGENVALVVEALTEIGGSVRTVQRHVHDCDCGGVRVRP